MRLDQDQVQPEAGDNDLQYKRRCETSSQRLPASSNYFSGLLHGYGQRLSRDVAQVIHYLDQDRSGESYIDGVWPVAVFVRTTFPVGGVADVPRFTFTSTLASGATVVWLAESVIVVAAGLTVIE